MTLKLKATIWDYLLPVAILIITIVIFVKYYQPA